jgi:hypothetical protein
MKTKYRSSTVSLGLWIAVGTFGCGGNNTSTPGNSASAGGGTSSSSAATNAGGHTSLSSGTQVGGAAASVGGSGTTGVVTGGNSAVGETGGTSTKNTDGTKATGGASAAGGATTATGGKSAGAGGSKAVGGTSTAGGTKATGGTTAAVQTGSCTITQKTGAVSSTIGPVGIVTFTVSGVSALDSAEIKFGLDTTYGLSAPVDVSTASTDYRTLLLGMKASKAYHYQIVGKSGGATCTSPDYTITAGGCPTSIKRPTVATTSGVNKSQLDGGFVVMEGYKATTDDYAYILDGDSDLVWCYHPTGFSDLTATRMSWDGKYMWIAHGNVPSGTSHMGRVSMDGDFKDYTSQFPGLNHDAVVLPNDEAVAYIAYSTGTCDDIKEWSPTTGTSKTIINASSVFSDGGACHCNAIKYDDSDDTLIVSEDDRSAYFKVTRQGVVKWILGGGTKNQFDKSGGGASTWTGEHNLHIIGTDAAGLYHLLFFNNGTSGTSSSGTSSVAREIALDLKAMTTKAVWSYTANINNTVMGDVQRLDNGNTIIAYSLSGVIHEVDSTGKLLQSLTWGSGSGSIGYITKRKTLYGPSPR